MGFRFSRRVNLGGGVGLNLSKSGVSPSYRSKFGSIGPRGFTVRTGIPGLSYRAGKGRGGDAALIALLVSLSIAAIVIAAVVAWNILRFGFWAIVETYHFFLRRKLKHDAGEAPQHLLRKTEDDSSKLGPEE